MLNHIFTLLVNEAGPAFYEDVPGSLPIGPHEPKPPSLEQQRIRAILFGARPDRHMLYWRAYQLIRAIEASSLRAELTARDARRTPYRTDIFSQYPFAYGKLEILSEDVPHAALRWMIPADHENLPIADSAGRIVWRWEANVDTGQRRVQLRALHEEGQVRVFELDFQNSYSQYVAALAPLGWQLSFPERDQAVVLRAYVKPQFTLPHLVAQLERGAHEDVEAVLAPYAQLHAVWERATVFDPTEKMAALALALAYCLEDQPR